MCQLKVRASRMDDLPQIRKLDFGVNGDAECKSDWWARTIAARSNTVIAATWMGNVVGVAVIGKLSKRLRIYRLMVCPWHRWNGVGSALLYWIIGFGTQGKRSIIIDVPESNLDGQAFLSNCSFKGRLIAKPAKTRDGWQTPETIGETEIYRFTMTKKRVAALCSRIKPLKSQ